jgi:pyridoxamine 5'-phosphate oxidase-like protein
VYHGAVSRRLGDSLPAPLQQRLSGRDLRERMTEAILVTTTDAQGRPHPAMLSYGEVVAIDARTLRFASHRGSTTAANLRERGAITFCLIGPGTAYYLKAQARELSPRESLARFEARVEDVLADEARADLEGPATIATGIGFLVANPAARLEAWSAQVADLRAAAPEAGP